MTRSLGILFVAALLAALTVVDAGTSSGGTGHAREARLVTSASVPARTAPAAVAPPASTTPPPAPPASQPTLPPARATSSSSSAPLVPAPAPTTEDTTPTTQAPPPPPTCPVDGSTFAWGSCTVPAGVAGPGVPVEAGAPSQITDPAGCGLAVVPAGYTAPGTYQCQPTPDRHAS